MSLATVVVDVCVSVFRFRHLPQVQLIMGKTLVDRMGEMDARVAMRGVKRGQVGGGVGAWLVGQAQSPLVVISTPGCMYI